MSGYLKHVVNGTIYHSCPILAANKMCVPVTEEEAFPERFKNAKTIAKVKARGKPVDVSTPDKDIDAATNGAGAAQVALGADASRGLPK